MKLADYVCKGGEWKSASMFEDFCFEGLVFLDDKQELYLPELMLSGDLDVEELSCQCASSKGLCIHKAALIYAADIMLTMECSEWNLALKKHCELNGIEYQEVK